MEDYELELDASELEPPKSYTPERAEEIAELMDEIAKGFDEILNMDEGGDNGE